MRAFTESVVEAAAVRDTLLPKLISGELRVDHAAAWIKLPWTNFFAMCAAPIAGNPGIR